MKKIYFVIEHINGEIEGTPFIIKKKDLKEYYIKGYLVYEIDIKKNIIKEIY